MDIEFEDWQKLDLRVAEILKVKDHPNADKLYVLEVKLSDKKRTIIAGLRNDYTREELIGKKIIVFVNLKPVKIRGIKSEGMLLAASNQGKIVIITPDKDICPGAKIS